MRCRWDRLLKSSLSGMRGLSVPLSLREQAAGSLARYYNSEECLPPRGWFNYIECEVLTRLKPHLFIDYLYMRGEILALKKDYSDAEFELVLKKLFASFCDYRELSMPIRSLFIFQINQYMDFLRKSPSIEHSFYLLGLRDKQEAQYRAALQEQDGGVEMENANCDFNYRLLSIYMTRCKPNVYLVLAPSKALLDLMKNFEPERQKLFSRPSSFDFRADRGQYFLQLFERYSKMNNFVQFCAVLEAVQTARLNVRPHSALYLCLYILFEFEMGPKHSKHKFFIYRTAVECLATFNCSYDMTLAILELMEKSISRDSDYCQFVLAKQYFLRAVGFTKQENLLFEMCFRQKVFIEQSTHYKDFLENHASCMLLNCENLALEIWLAKRDVKFGKCKKLKKKVKEFTFVVKNILYRLREIFSPLKEMRSPTSNLAEEILFRREMLTCVILCVNGSNYLSHSSAYKCRKQNPPSVKSKLYDILFDAFGTESAIDRDRHLSKLRPEYEIVRGIIERGSDWKNSLDMGELIFEILVFLICTDLHSNCRVLTRELYDEASAIYRNLSSLQKHPRLALLELLGRRLFFFEATSDGADFQFLNWQGQVISNLEVRELACFDKNATACDIVRFFFRRDGHYLNNVLGFGYQSVACCGGT